MVGNPPSSAALLQLRTISLDFITRFAKSSYASKGGSTAKHSGVCVEMTLASFSQTIQLKQGIEHSFVG